MVTHGQGLVEDCAFGADEFEERELCLGAEIVNASVESGAIVGVSVESRFDAIERRWRLPAIVGPGVDTTILAE